MIYLDEVFVVLSSPPNRLLQKHCPLSDMDAESEKLEADSSKGDINDSKVDDQGNSFF